MTLYEIKENYLAFLDSIEGNEIPQDVIKDTLDSIEGDLTEKVDNIASYIKNLKAEANSIREEEKALADRRRSKEYKIERLENYLSETLQTLNKNLIETPRNRVSFRKSQVLMYTDADASTLDDKWFRIKYELNKEMITKALKNGEKVSEFYLQEKKNIQIK